MGLCHKAYGYAARPGFSEGCDAQAATAISGNNGPKSGQHYDWIALRLGSSRI